MKHCNANPNYHPPNTTNPGLTSRGFSIFQPDFVGRSDPARLGIDEVEPLRGDRARRQRDARVAEKLSQPELADLLGTTRQTVGGMETERVSVSPEMATKLCLTLRSLSPAKLVRALGYPVVATAESQIPANLARLLSQLDSDGLAIVERLVRGLLAPSATLRRQPSLATVTQIMHFLFQRSQTS